MEIKLLQKAPGSKALKDIIVGECFEIFATGDPRGLLHAKTDSHENRGQGINYVSCVEIESGHSRQFNDAIFVMPKHIVATEVEE